MIDSIYYVFYNLRAEFEIALQRKKLCKSCIIAALNTVNIPLLDKKGARVEGRAGEYYINGIRVKGVTACGASMYISFLNGKVQLGLE